ncbi:hypothetical protein DRN93_05560 [archaeon]|nr:MAG: hypothetical protein DRN93_05560 [archaeon]
MREDWLLRNGVYLKSEDETLTYSKGVYRSQHRNWVYHVRSGIDNVDYPPIISDDNGVISAQHYQTNYIDGSVKFTDYTPVGSVKATYTYLIHLITSSWEIISESENVRTPYVVITNVDRSSRPLQLGGGVWAVLDVTLQIGEYDSGAYTAFARAEELADIILSGVSKIPIVDYSGDKFPLTLGGYLKSTYDLESQIIGYYTLIDGSQMHYSLPMSTKGYARRVVKFSVMVPDEG